MKKTLLITVLLFLLVGTGLYAQDKTAATTDRAQKIEMYYFHTSFRCATCRAVEAQSKEAFESLYADKFESGNASFQAVNIDEDENAALVERYKIAGQTLLVVKGDKTADLTSEGFLYAKTDPAKLKEAIKEAVDKL